MMAKKLTYGELEQRIKELEKEALERKCVEEELRENSARYRTLLEIADDAIAFKDSEGLYVEVNKEFIRRLGLSNEEIIGKSAQDVYPKEVGAKIFENDLEVLKTGRLREFEDRYPTPEETTIVSLARKVPIRDESGKVVGLLAIARDITARKQAEEMLRKTHDELEQQVEERTAELSKANEQLKREIEERKRTEEALRVAQEQLGTIIDSVPALIAFKDKNNRYIRINKTYAEAINLPRETIEEKSAFDITQNREQAEKYWRDDQEVMASGKPKRNIIEPMLFDETRIGQTDKIPYRDDKGNIIGVILFCIDITSRVKAEEALKESEERHRTLVESTSDAILMMDTERNIVSCNQSFLDLFGYDENEVKGRSIRIIHQSDESFRSFGEVAYPAIERDGTFRGEWDFVRKDGTIFPVESVTSVIKSPDGLTTGYVAIIRDISERRQAEEALRESENRYRDLYEEAPNANFSIRFPVGEIVRCNKAALNMLGYNKDTLTGMNVYDLYPNTPHGVAKVKEVFERFKRGESIRDEELQMKHKDGYPIWISLSVEPVRDANGNILESRSMAVDISKRKLLQDKLFKSECLAATGQLAASVAHEINSPLQAIIDILDMIKNNKTDGEFSDHIDRLTGGINKIRDIVKNLLDLNRPGRELKQNTDVNNLIQNTVNLLYGKLDKNNLKINLNLFHNIPSIFASPQRLNQLFINLINNAIDSICNDSMNQVSHRGEITIGTNYKGGNILIRFMDTGPGIPERDLDRIFDPFFSTRNETGMGLGLSICHDIVMEHNGTIMARNLPSRGATFIIILPVN